MKKCTKCGLEKENDSFYDRGDNKKRAECKECSNLRSLNWRKINKEKHVNFVRKSQLKNKERFNRYQREYMKSYDKTNFKDSELNIMFVQIINELLISNKLSHIVTLSGKSYDFFYRRRKGMLKVYEEDISLLKKIKLKLTS